jgi:hypothetical protein
VTRFPVCCTFDLDLVRDDECDFFFSKIVPQVSNARIRAPTLFVRIDNQVGARYGRPDYVYRTYRNALERMTSDGWEIGWHLQSYQQENGVWKQNTNEEEVVDELNRNGVLARELGMRIARMGWGFHTNHTILALCELGFLVDSSAIPRPIYSWEQSIRNWEGAPLEPYLPSRVDYRRADAPHLPLIEVPMSVAAIPASYDQEIVMRYLNPAFASDCWRIGLRRWLPEHGCLVTISHPDEFMPANKPHALIGYRLETFAHNIAILKEEAGRVGKVIEWLTISALANACFPAMYNGANSTY